jgi:acyl-CoA hydrolase
MLDPETIRLLFEQHLPTAWLSTSANDEDDADISRDYILQVLQDEVSYDDPHELAETLQSILGDATDALVDALLKTLRGDTSRSTLKSPLALTAEP